ncbi:hypothetical protein EIN_095080 [Entamoeba invadens IP1]|uniref:Uncharacterized protein n=1 Tax=Entamoeba invadens IP1 TaxID=370355 RepID=A0A0A1U611_ENTIV|nr:hypothetical protein EIN_095080 [Entamoeba invadens IP1]ELP87271.1 hypothetical protein EIN_095080 [Entamoeba invadens IP1]|eukprot:XP_004254042.1 hypothetical protein EIN_095080 [Entamoeba invadens IP1]
MNSLLTEFSDAAVVYPAHNKKCKRFAMTLSRTLNAEIFKISVYNPYHTTNRLVVSWHRTLARKTRSFQKRIECISSCSIDIDKFRCIIIVSEMDGNHMATESLSFINSFYMVIASSPTKPLVVGLGGSQRKFEKDIARVQALFVSENAVVDMPIFILNKQVLKYLNTIDAMLQYITLPKRKESIRPIPQRPTMFTERTTSRAKYRQSTSRSISAKVTRSISSNSD